MEGKFLLPKNVVSPGRGVGLMGKKETAAKKKMISQRVGGNGFVQNICPCRYLSN